VSNVESGRHFEDLAEAFLRDHGWRVLDRNVRLMRNEIDLVVEKGGLVAFVEVKGRRGTTFGHPLEAITWRKRRAISQAARLWIARSGIRARCYRFDAVAVRPDAAGTVDIEHVEGAWVE